MPAGVGYGDRKPPGLIISLDFLTPNKRKKAKSKKYGDEDEHEYSEEEERMSYADLARRRLAKKRRK